MYGKEDGSVPATFQIIFMVCPLHPLCTWSQPSFVYLGNRDGGTCADNQIGWKPGPNAPKPLERGSAQTNLKDILS
jgi:NADH dehydrogenase [ubiquinone] 1 alpha subcomplex assembly factor 5